MKSLFTALVLSLLVAGCEDDKGREYAETITVAQLGISAISIDHNDATVLEYGQAQSAQWQAAVTATAGDLDYTALVHWSTDTPAVATVSSKGAITPLQVGTAHISAAFGEFSANQLITVSDAQLESITLEPATISLPECQQLSVSAQGHYDDGSTRNIQGLEWSTGDTRIATVDDSNSSHITLLSHKAGTTTLSAQRVGSVSSSATTVTTLDTLASIRLSPTQLTLEVGASGIITAEGSYDDGSSADISPSSSWSLTDSAHASIVELHSGYSAENTLTATAAGTAIVKAECGGISANQNTAVTVTEPVTLDAVRFDISHDPWQLTIDDKDNKSLELFADYSDNSHSNVTEDATWEIITGDDDYIRVSDDSGSKGEITLANNIDDITTSQSVTIRASYEEKTQQIVIEVVAP